MLDPTTSKLDQSHDTQNRCAVCNKQFKSPSKLYLHLLIHTGEKPFKCDICEIGFRQNSHLRDHDRKHHPDLPVKPKNKKHKTSFERKSRQQIQYQNYLKSRNNTTDKNEIESQSQTDQITMAGSLAKARAMFNNSINESLKYTGLNTITAINHKQKQCDVCGKKFQTPAKLKRHFLSHTGERPHSCEICEYKFAQNCHLKYHYKNHHPDLPFPMPSFKNPNIKTSVERKSRQQIQYQDYLKSQEHTTTDKNEIKNESQNPKQKQCDVCGKNFQTPAKLKRHFLSHTGERPFSCEFCEKQFAQDCHLKYHYKKNHPDLPMLSFKNPNIKPLIHKNSKNNSKIQESVGHSENQEYIRKRKPNGFTSADFDGDFVDDEEEAFECNYRPNTSKLLPKRDCKKNIVYNENNIVKEKNDNKIEESVGHSENEDENIIEDNNSDDQDSNPDKTIENDIVKEKNNSDEKSHQNSVSETKTEDDEDDLKDEIEIKKEIIEKNTSISEISNNPITNANEFIENGLDKENSSTMNQKNIVEQAEAKNIKKENNKNIEVINYPDFQSYIDAVKENKIPWNIFANFMDDLASNMDRSKNLNSILMNELKSSLENERKLKFEMERLKRSKIKASVKYYIDDV